MYCAEILQKLESLGSSENVAGMVRYGITPRKAFGVSAPQLKQLAKEVVKSGVDRHALALELWKTEIHEARALAFLIEDPLLVTCRQMESWAKDFDNWAICDSCCGTLFRKTPFAYEKAFEWAERNEEFVKRAGFAMMAWLAVHDKKASNEKIAAFLPVIEKHAHDERNLVKKAINWALRQIGKRNLKLNQLAIQHAERLGSGKTKVSRWIAADALRELKSKKLAGRLLKKERQK